jgi:hypothetical protein
MAQEPATPAQTLLTAEKQTALRVIILHHLSAWSAPLATLWAVIHRRATLALTLQHTDNLTALLAAILGAKANPIAFLRLRWRTT